MPTYAYACTECGHRFDAVQSFTDPTLTECPECSGRLRKLFSAVGIVFKGSGFYRTDSRAQAKSDAGKKSGAAKEPAAASSSSTDSSGSGDSSSTKSSTSNSSSSTSGTTSTERKAS